MTTRNLISFGKSGWPLLSHGAELCVRSVSPDAFRFGDLVVFCGARVQVCHRILGRRVESGLSWYLLKGDANLHADGWVPAYRILGRVELINGKNTAAFPNNWINLAFACVSFLQWHAYEWVFHSSLGVLLRRVRERYWPRPLLVGFFKYLLAPWLLFQPNP